LDIFNLRTRYRNSHPDLAHVTFRMLYQPAHMFQHTPLYSRCGVRPDLCHGPDLDDCGPEIMQAGFKPP
jgi:hypothetical protein